MKTKVLKGQISVKGYYSFWQHNARTNQGQNPGPPPAIVTYQERLGVNKGLRMMRWRNMEGFECKGTTAAHDEAVKATERETSHDPTARENGDDKEADRRIKAAASQNKKNNGFCRRPRDNQRQRSCLTKVKLRWQQKDRKDYRTRASESPPPKPITKKEKSRSGSPSPDRKKGPQTSKVDLSSSDSS